MAAGCCLAARISQMKGNLTEEEVKDIKEVFIKFGMNGDISELLLRILSKQRNPIRRWLEIKLNSYYYIPSGKHILI